MPLARECLGLMLLSPILERELEAALEAMTEEEYDPAVIDALLS